MLARSDGAHLRRRAHGRHAGVFETAKAHFPQRLGGVVIVLLIGLPETCFRKVDEFLSRCHDDLHNACKIRSRPTGCFDIGQPIGAPSNRPIGTCEEK